jgi:hypothetical protein
MSPPIESDWREHFLSGDTFRNGQQSAIAVDVIALMDALQIDKAIRPEMSLPLQTTASSATEWLLPTAKRGRS